MKLFHVTPRRNKVSILKRGLLRSFSQCKYGLIYLVAREDVSWAVSHIRQRWATDDVVVLYVNLVRIKPRRVGYCMFAVDRDITPRRVLGQLAWEG